MSSPAPAQTTQVVQNQLPAWVSQAGQQNYQQAQQVAARPYQQYSGQWVADPSQMTNQAYGMIGQQAATQPNVSAIPNISSTGILDATSPYYQAATNLYNTSAQGPNIQQFMNPYTQDVTNSTIGLMNQQLQQQLAGNQATATQAGAFGGTRGAVQNAVTQAQGLMNIGNTAANLNQNAYSQALTAGQQQQQAQQNAATGLLNTAAATQGSQNAQQAALQSQQNQQMALANNQQQYNMNNINALLGAGQQQQNQQQNQINAAMQQFQNQWNAPIDALNLQLAALGMTPYDTTQTTNKTSTAEQLGPDWSSIGLGALKALPALFALSDRDMKTDIEKLGHDLDLDLPIYAYRYKNDPKTYPKLVGPMAQDVEKKYPKAVKKMGGHKVIDINNLMEALA